MFLYQAPYENKLWSMFNTNEVLLFPVAFPNNSLIVNQPLTVKCDVKSYLHCTTREQWRGRIGLTQSCKHLPESSFCLPSISLQSQVCQSFSKPGILALTTPRWLVLSHSQWSTFQHLQRKIQLYNPCHQNTNLQLTNNNLHRLPWKIWAPGPVTHTASSLDTPLPYLLCPVTSHAEQALKAHSISHFLEHHPRFSPSSIPLAPHQHSHPHPSSFLTFHLVFESFNSMSLSFVFCFVCFSSEGDDRKWLSIKWCFGIKQLQDNQTFQMPRTVSSPRSYCASNVFVSPSNTWCQVKGFYHYPCAV